MVTSSNILLELKGITKRFPGVVANDMVTFNVREGEVHALVGENGAGKSTLMKILAGLYQPDQGEILFNGTITRISNPRAAVDLRIGMVHQHFMLIDSFSVTENVILGYEDTSSRGLLNRGRAEAKVKEICKRYGFNLDPPKPVGELSVGQQQRVEILKVLYRGADLLILDEPTAVLVPQEVDDLFENLRQLKAQGKTIIFINHKLDEVLSIADRITVLRRGKTIGTVDASNTSKPDLAQMMVGRPVLFDLPREEPTPLEPLVSTRNLVAQGTDGRVAVDGVDLEVRGGEIYGVAGVEGNGQTELLEAIVGLIPAKSGSIHVGNLDVTACSQRLLGSTVAFIPEDRHRRGLVLPMTLWENALLGSHRDPALVTLGLIDNAVARQKAEAIVDRFDVRTSSVSTPVHALSGGNQQKVIIGREFDKAPDVIVAAQPTRGLDVGAAEFVREQLLAARQQGKAILLVSADLEEILSLSDRIGVMYEGRIVKEFDGADVTPEELGLYMTGSGTRDLSREGGATVEAS